MESSIIVFTKERLFMLFMCVRLFMLFIRESLFIVFTKESGPDSSVGIATGYGLRFLLLILFMLLVFIAVSMHRNLSKSYKPAAIKKCLFGLYRLTEEVGHNRNVYKWIRK